MQNNFYDKKPKGNTKYLPKRNGKYMNGRYSQDFMGYPEEPQYMPFKQVSSIQNFGQMKSFEPMKPSTQQVRKQFDQKQQYEPPMPLSMAVPMPMQMPMSMPVPVPAQMPLSMPMSTSMASTRDPKQQQQQQPQQQQQQQLQLQQQLQPMQQITQQQLAKQQQLPQQLTEQPTNSEAQNFESIPDSSKEVKQSLEPLLLVQKETAQGNISKAVAENSNLADPEKHPLRHKWTLWYWQNDPTKSWEDMQVEIAKFDTVEDFWTLHNYIKVPSELHSGCDYSMFKTGIRPMWEDPANINGGRWLITFNKGIRFYVDGIWLDCLLCLIGESFEKAEHFCGAVINVRNNTYKISIWTANGSDEDAILEVGYELKKALKLGNMSMVYQLHTDTMQKKGSYLKSLYTI